jgi:hypothetical protein
MNDLEWLQSWYSRHCDGDWEHGQGVSITTLDNPGWSLDIDLADTEMEQVHFESVSRDVSEVEWIFCRIKDGQFQGRCGAHQLIEMISIFRSWCETVKIP